MLNLLMSSNNQNKMNVFLKSRLHKLINNIKQQLKKYEGKRV